jgi:hypothetical protein
MRKRVNIIRAVLYNAKVCKQYTCPYCLLCVNKIKDFDITIIIIIVVVVVVVVVVSVT